MFSSIKELVRRSAFEKSWVHYHDDYRIEVINWWSLLGMNGESYHLNGKLVGENFSWILSSNSQYIFPIENIGHCKVVIGSKWSGLPGCHIFINDELVGGDVDFVLSP